MQNLLRAAATWVIASTGDLHASLGRNGSSSHGKPHPLPHPVLFPEFFYSLHLPSSCFSPCSLPEGSWPHCPHLILAPRICSLTCICLSLLIPWPQPGPLPSHHCVSSPFLLPFFTQKLSPNLIPCNLSLHLHCLLSCIFVGRVKRKKPQPWLKSTQWPTFAVKQECSRAFQKKGEQ